jgi:chromosome segregation ATPase
MGLIGRFRRERAVRDERLRRLEERVQAQGERLDRHRARLGDQRDALDLLTERLDRRVDQLEQQALRAASQRERMREAVQSASKVTNTMDILASHVASLETRIADLTQHAGGGPVAEAGEMDAARSLLDEVRAEHARVRTRFGAVAVFEERLRRLEEALLADTTRTREEFERAARRLSRELDAGEEAAAD